MTDHTLVAYKSMPIWTKDSLPEAVQEKHNTKVGTWGKISVLQGQLKFYQLDEQGQVLDSFIFDKDSQIPFVQPQAWHKVQALSDDLQMQLTFYCQLEDYFHKKYGLTKTHSEVIFAKDYLKDGSKVLDLGSGQGRNSLYLTMLGHQVTSVDANGQSLVKLEDLAQAENLPATIDWYDINSAAIDQDYDFILSTVVFMFLQADAVPDIIKNMQERTKIGGYNLIVAAMDTAAHPCPMPFPFTFKEGQLRDYYQGWELIKYNEDLGQLHRLDENGKRMELQFATILAKKVQEAVSQKS